MSTRLGSDNKVVDREESAVDAEGDARVGEGDAEIFSADRCEDRDRGTCGQDTGKSKGWSYRICGLKTRESGLHH